MVQYSGTASVSKNRNLDMSFAASCHEKKEDPSKKEKRKEKNKEKKVCFCDAVTQNCVLTEPLLHVSHNTLISAH